MEPVGLANVKDADDTGMLKRIADEVFEVRKGPNPVDQLFGVVLTGEAGKPFAALLTGVKKALQNPGDNTLVSIVDCLGPLIILHIQLLPEVDELVSHTSDELSWGQPFARGSNDGSIPRSANI